MPNNLLLMAWPHGDEILTQLMWSSGYDLPVPYTGEATITQISSTITDDNYELIFRCEGCLSWDQGGAMGGISSSSGFMLLGWAHAYDPPGSPECPAEVAPLQHDTQYIFPAVPDANIANPSYEEWAALATNTVVGDCGDGPDPTDPVPTPTGVPVPDETYDWKSVV